MKNPIDKFLFALGTLGILFSLTFLSACGRVESDDSDVQFEDGGAQTYFEGKFASGFNNRIKWHFRSDGKFDRDDISNSIDDIRNGDWRQDGTTLFLRGQNGVIYIETECAILNVSQTRLVVECQNGWAKITMNRVY